MKENVFFKHEVVEPEEKYRPELDVDAVLRERDILQRQKGRYPRFDLLERGLFARMTAVGCEYQWEKGELNIKMTPPATEIFSNCLTRVVERIKQETEFQQEFDELVQIDALLNFHAYLKEKNIDNEGLYSGDNRKAIAKYHPDAGYISLWHTKQVIHSYAALRALATMGAVQDLKTIAHEEVHRRQYDASKTLTAKDIVGLTSGIGFSVGVLASFLHNNLITSSNLAGIMAVLAAIAVGAYCKLEKSGREKRALEEAQAYKVDGVSTMKLVGHLKHQVYRLSRRGDVDRIIIASKQVDRLRALGMAHEEIGRLVKSVKWNKKKSEFDTLQTAINQLAREKDFAEEDLDTISDIQRIKRQNLYAHVQLIALEELSGLSEGINKQIMEPERRAVNN